MAAMVELPLALIVLLVVDDDGLKLIRTDRLRPHLRT
jgi:hypothetical protein